MLATANKPTMPIMITMNTTTSIMKEHMLKLASQYLQETLASVALATVRMM